MPLLREAQDDAHNGEAYTVTPDGRTHSVFLQPDGTLYYRAYSPHKFGYTAKDVLELRAYLLTLEGQVPSLYSDEWTPRLFFTSCRSSPE